MKRVIASFVLSMLSLTATAQGRGHEACGPDTRRYCSSASGGGVEKIKECLLDHQKDISDACYDLLKKELSQGGNAQAQGPGGDGGPAAPACRDDVPKFCKGVQPGGGRIKECLLDHQKEISDACHGSLNNQKSGSDGRGIGAGAAAASDRAVFRSRQADGSTVYSETPQSNAASVKRVQFLNGNTALPSR